MKKFKFRLENVLALRTRIEQDKKRDLALVNKELVEATHKIGLFKGVVNQTSLKMKEKTKNTVDVAQVMFFNSYILQLKQLIQFQHQKVHEINQRLEEKRKILAVATQNRKIIEKLKEKQYDEFMKNAERQEQLFIDDIAISKYIRDRKQ